jgi:hypothetical protein
MAASNYREWFLQLRDTVLDKPIDDDTGKYQVYTAGSAVRQTIYAASGATLTQEVVGTSFISRTMTDGKIRFFTNATCSSLDISILTAKGRAYFLKALAPSQHTVHVDPTTNSYVLVAAFNDKASCTTVRPIGFQLKKGMMINDVRVQVTAAFAGAAAASNQYSVGRSGAALGFINNLTLSAVGFRNPAPTPSTTGFAIKSRYGSDLSYFHSSSTGGVDLYVRKSFIAPATSSSGNLVVKRQTAATLTHSFTNTGVSGAGKGYIYYMYTLLPTEV